MSDELPPDVRSTLVRLFEEAAEDARTRDDEAVRSTLETAETVAEEDVPAGAEKERLRHGCAQVRKTVENEPLVAAEYLRAMRRLVADDADEGRDDEETDGSDGDENFDGGRDADEN